MSVQAAEPPFINDDVYIFDKIRRGSSAMAANAVKLTGLDCFDDGPEIDGPQVVDPLGVNHRSICEDLQ